VTTPATVYGNDDGHCKLESSSGPHLLLGFELRPSGKSTTGRHQGMAVKTVAWGTRCTASFHEALGDAFPRV
jgi:hypothetical protein